MATGTCIWGTWFVSGNMGCSWPGDSTEQLSLHSMVKQLTYQLGKDAQWWTPFIITKRICKYTSGELQLKHLAKSVSPSLKQHLSLRQCEPGEMVAIHKNC